MSKTVYEVPMNFGNDLNYVHGPLGRDLWTSHMLFAQDFRKPLILSGEWSDTARYLREHQSEYERPFVGESAWTGTVLDYTDGTLKERIKLSPDGSYAEFVTLGEEDGIYLPEESSTIEKLHDKYMPLIARLHSVKDPRVDILHDAYFVVAPDGRRPVVRGCRALRGPGHRRVNIYADYNPADRMFVAWLVDKTQPMGAIYSEELKKLIVIVK